MNKKCHDCEKVDESFPFCKPVFMTMLKNEWVYEYKNGVDEYIFTKGNEMIVVVKKDDDNYSMFTLLNIEGSWFPYKMLMKKDFINFMNGIYDLTEIERRNSMRGFSFGETGKLLMVLMKIMNGE